MDGFRAHGSSDGRIVVDVERRVILLVLVKQEEGERGIRIVGVVRVIRIIRMLRWILAIGISGAAQFVRNTRTVRFLLTLLRHFVKVVDSLRPDLRVLANRGLGVLLSLPLTNVLRHYRLFALQLAGAVLRLIRNEHRIFVIHAHELGHVDVVSVLLLQSSHLLLSPLFLQLLSTFPIVDATSNRYPCMR